MQITVTTLSDQIFTLDVSEDLELENFKALCEFEIGIPASEIAIVSNGRPLHDDKRTLKQYEIKNGDMVLLQHIRGVQGQQSVGPHSTPGTGNYGNNVSNNINQRNLLLLKSFYLVTYFRHGCLHKSLD